MKITILLLTPLLIGSAIADPKLTSWFTANSGQYARIYQSKEDETAGIKSATWSRGSGNQASPVYADIHEIRSSANWIYLRTSGLASHVMGPWYLNAGKTNLFPNFPSNTSTVYRIPRTTTIPTIKTNTGNGAIGRMVNGVSMFDSRDTLSYRNSTGTDSTVGGPAGDGIWNRDGYHNEGVTFDAALAHQAGNNYHYHAQPIGLRHQLGDHVEYNATTNRYTESATQIIKHSPILAWAADGLPVYGPYGYSSPMNAGSGVRRMVSGFALRNGSNGTTAITVRQVLPPWAQRIQNRTTLTASQYGPAVNTTTYLLGHYIEDFDYRGDLGQTHGVDFDLNEQNVRYCVTPEFPSGTWAYFTTINADGTPAYPYTTGRQYFGSPTGGGSNLATMNADTPLTTHYLGGANTPLEIKSASVDNGTVTLTWSAVEGGTYSVDASPDQTTWTSKAAGTVSTSISKSVVYLTLSTSGTEYGRVTRTAIATYDTAGQTAATAAQTTSTSYVAGTPATGLQSWRQTWYGTQANSGNSADGADPYGTGIQNLAVYAFFGPAQNPATAKIGELPQAILASGFHTFDFTEPAGVNGITYSAQWRTDMHSNWQSATDTGTGSHHIFSVPVGDQPQLFMRLKVTSP